MQITRSRAKEVLKDCLPDYLQAQGIRATGRRNFRCLNPAHNDSTPSMTYYQDAQTVYCHGCRAQYDIFDLIGLDYGLSDFADQMNKAAELFGYTLVNDSSVSEPTREGGRKHTAPAPDQTDPEQDFTEYLVRAAKANDFKYLEGRGISRAVQERFRVGFDPAWIHPKADPARVQPSPRCIIPNSRYSYLARDTRPALDEKQKPFSKMAAGRKRLFNATALKKGGAVFVAEGEIDALSIIEAGAEAIGLCGAANISALLAYLKEHKNGQRLVLMLDQDETGRKKTEELKAGLDALCVQYIEYTPKTQETPKDPNAFLCHDRQGFISEIKRLKGDAEALKEKQQGGQYSAAALLDYFRTIEDRPPELEAKTGFSLLDAKLNGGLQEGLYIIGAISSLGKTTFTLQIADQIASSGQDVLFFSLEMSAKELIAKSLSRYTYTGSQRQKQNGHYIARDTAQILNSRKYSNFSTRERENLNEAIKDYSLSADCMFIYEGRYEGQRLTVQLIREIVRKHIEETGRKPVVFIDYLQIIAPADPRQSDKQNTDAAVFELKEISRDWKIPVVAISSFNRDNYSEPVSMASFKESGAIEYSSDVLFGLQYAGMDYQSGESEKARAGRLRDLTKEVFRLKEAKEPIDIELKCLKYRNGYQFTIPFRMVAAFNFFEECDPMKEDFAATEGRKMTVSF